MEKIPYKIVEKARPAQVQLADGTEVPVYGNRKERRKQLQDVKRSLKKRYNNQIKYAMPPLQERINFAKLGGKTELEVHALTESEMLWCKTNNIVVSFTAGKIILSWQN